MFTVKNYFDKIKEVDVQKLPAKLRERYEFVKEVTQDHTSWEFYHADNEIKATVERYLSNLSNAIDKPTAAKNTKATPAVAKTPVSEAAAREVAKELIRVYVLRGDTVQQLSKSQLGRYDGNFDIQLRTGKIHVNAIKGEKVSFIFPIQQIYDEIWAENPKPAAKPDKPTKTKAPKQTPAPRKTSRIDTKNAKPVEKIDEELRFIKRYILLHGKEKTDAQILNFINALQRAIVEKRIRKTSSFAEQVNYIQDSLVKTYNKMGSSTIIKIRDTVLSEMMQLAGSEKVRLSVAYMKRYISIQGKQITKEKAAKLYNLIAAAINKNKLPANDPYMDRMKRILTSLKTFSKTASKDDTLHIHQAALNGIQEALNGCPCGCEGKKKRKNGLHGLDGVEKAGDNLSPETVMNSMDFVKVKFDTLGFTGKWLELIGDPSRNFTAMVFAKPKMGKSYLCVDFAGYLARSHGRVLYVAKEEGLDLTLQEKLEDKNVKHPNLFVTGSLPASLADFDFIFLDSVTRLGLTPDDLRELKAQYPTKSFIYVFQSTKAGNFRGENSFQHDVDVVIEVPEKGKAVQMGRYNQGGELQIFDNVQDALNE